MIDLVISCGLPRSGNRFLSAHITSLGLRCRIIHGKQGQFENIVRSICTRDKIVITKVKAILPFRNFDFWVRSIGKESTHGFGKIFDEIKFRTLDDLMNPEVVTKLKAYAHDCFRVNLAWLAANQIPVLPMCYESIVASPEVSLCSLHEFLGVENPGQWFEEVYDGNEQYRGSGLTE